MTKIKLFKVKEPAELLFLQNCPYFLDKCKSINWDLEKSPCVKCIKNKTYNPLNAEVINIFKVNSR